MQAYMYNGELSSIRFGSVLMVKGQAVLMATPESAIFSALVAAGDITEVAEVAEAVEVAEVAEVAEVTENKGKGKGK